jgi:uncharacterized protein
VPLLAVVCTRIDAVVAQTVVGFFVTTYHAWKLRADVDRRLLSRALPASIVGMPLGILVGHVVSDRALRFVLGISVILAATAIAKGWRFRSRPELVDIVSGGVSGILSTTTGTSGPPIVIGMAGRDLSPAATRSSLQAIFMVANFVTIGLFAADGSLTKQGIGVGVIGLVPAVLVRRSGERMFRRLNPDLFRKLVLALLFVAGAVALITAIVKK